MKQHGTEHTQKVPLNILSDAEETPNKELPLTTHEPIENTPFTITGHDKEYFIRMGDYRLTEIKKTKLETWEELERNLWNIILKMIGAVLDRHEKDKHAE